MKWNLDNNRPIYVQLIEHITLAIIAGEFAPGSKFPSVRDLAGEAGVNPNTMQRALGELERQGLLYTQRTNGRFITEDSNMIEQTRENFACEQIECFFEKMQSLGFSKQQTIELLSKNFKEGK